ncbi:MAG TPA: phage holin family protein [Sphingomicrobium sp.]|nr:phage holin family protein [Sphingomicrobium sp.]
MVPDSVKDTALPRALSDALGDVADLVQKELRFARAEISEKISTKVQAAVWLSVAGALGLITAILAVEALVFGIASYGIAMHWSCLIVAGVFGCLAALTFFKGRANAAQEMTPTRTLHNVKRDIATAKEQLR